jgi:hypothetical protein
MQKFSKPPTFNRMFANRRMKVFVGSLILLVFSSVFYVQCAKENDITNPLDNSITASFRTDYVLRLQYDTEVTTHFIVDGDLEESLDIAAQTPTITKHNVIIEITENGEVTMQMIVLEPSQTLNIAHQELPNTLPEPHKTIIGGGKIQIFDKNDILLYTEDFELPSAAEVIAMLGNLGNNYTNVAINQMLAQGQSSLFIEELRTYLDNAAANGFTVNHINNDFVTIEEPLDTNDQNADVVVSLIDKNKNLVVANRLYDASKNWKSSIMYRYNEGQYPTLKATKENSYVNLPSGLSANMEVYSTYENLEFDVNL